MNRVKKEEKRKYDEARKGLSGDQIAVLDLEDLIKAKVEKLARKIHVEKYSEEYDFMYDSISDAKDRSKNINPMRHAYIEKINKKRETLGVTQLSDSGTSVSNDTLEFCLQEAKKQIYSDLSLKRPPSKTCVLCDRTFEEVGGKRITAQQLRGVTLSNNYQGGANKDYPHQSVKLYDDLEIYVSVWGEKEKWTDKVIQKAREEYKTGYRPWFCQACAERTCSECGAPKNMPMGSDVLDGSGCSSHVAIFPVDPGCVDKNCPEYKSCS